jgi:hypothetical protein
VFQAIGEDAEDESLDLGDRFIPGGTVGHGPRNYGDFSDPPAVLFSFDFDFHGLSFDLKGRDVNGGEGALLRSVSAGSLSFGGFKVEGD